MKGGGSREESFKEMFAKTLNMPNPGIALTNSTVLLSQDNKYQVLQVPHPGDPETRAHIITRNETELDDYTLPIRKDLAPIDF